MAQYRSIYEKKCTGGRFQEKNYFQHSYDHIAFALIFSTTTMECWVITREGVERIEVGVGEGGRLINANTKGLKKKNRLREKKTTHA